MVALNDADDVWDCHWDAIPATDSTNLMLELRESQFRLCAVCSTTSMLSCFAVKTMDCAESGILCEIQEQYGVARYVLSPCDERTHFGHNQVLVLESRHPREFQYHESHLFPFVQYIKLNG